MAIIPVLRAAGAVRSPLDPANSIPCCGFHNQVKSDVFTYEEMQAIVELCPSARDCRNAASGRKRTFYANKP